MSNVIINPYNFVSAIPFPNTYSLDFGGVDDFVDCGNDSVFDFGTTSFSVSFWIKTTATSGAIIARGSVSGQSKPGYKFSIASVDNLQIWCTNQSNGVTYLTSTAVINDGDWHHIAASFDRGVADLLSLYIDGSLDGTIDISSMGDLSSTYNLFFGRQDNGAYYVGNLDEASIWNTALSSDDVSTLWNDGTPNNLNTALGTTPIGWWRCGDSGEYFNGNWELPNQPQLNNWSSHSMEFDGVDDRIAFTEVIYSGAFTCSLWIKPASLTLAFLIGDINSNSHFVWLLTASTIMLKINGTGYTFNEAGGNDIVVGSWQNITITRDGSNNVNAFRNGASFGGTSTLSGNFEINSIAEVYSAGNWNYNGNIDEVSIFNSALDASTITSIYNSGEPTDLSAFSKMSFNFDGVDDWIDMGTSFVPPSAISISVWIKTTMTTGGDSTNIGYIVTKDDVGSNRDFILNYRGTGYNKIFFAFWSPGGTATSFGSSAGLIADGDWHHVLVTWDGTTDSNKVQIFIDGSLDTQTTANDTGIRNSTGTNLTLAKADNPVSARLFIGNIDDVAIFNNDQSANVAAIYNSGKPTDLSEETGLVGYWKFDDALYNGATTEFSVPDSSTNSNTGDTVNMDFVDLETDAPLSPVAYYRLGEDSYWNGTNWWTPDYSKDTLYSQKSLDFGGVDDKIDIGTSLNLGINSTVSFWIKRNALGVAQGLLGEDTYSFDYLVWMNSNNYLYFRIASSYVGWTDGTTSSIMGDNSLPWIHVAIVRTGDDVELFLNSASMGTQSGVGAINDTRFDTIGAKSGGVQYANAKFDSVSCWDSVLDSNTISSIYNSGSPNNLTLAASYTGGSGVDKSGDLQGYWRMGEGITNWNGTNWQLPDYSKNALFSQKSFKFDGVDQYITTSAVGAVTGDATISFWMKQSTASGTSYEGVISSANYWNGGNDNNFSIQWYLNAQIRIASADGNSPSSNQTWTPPSFVVDTWYHVCIIMDYTDASTSEVTVYWNGVQISGALACDGRTFADIVNGVDIGAYSIGGIPLLQSCMAGNLDDISIYNEIKTPSDIYNLGVPKDESATSGLVAYWKFDDATFSSNWNVPDNSTNSNNGTSVNMTEVDLKFNTPTNLNSGLSSGMDEVDLEFNTPTNPNSGLSSGMAIDDKVNNAPDNINQGLSSGMDEADKVADVPPS